MAITDTEVRRWVVDAIEAYVGVGRSTLYDVDAIVRSLIKRHGHRTTYPDASLIGLMAAHRRGGETR